MSRSLEQVKADALRIVEPLRERYSAEMLASAVDHMLLHDNGERHGVPLQGLSDELKTCVCMCSVFIQAECNRRNGTDNPATFVRFERPA